MDRPSAVHRANAVLHFAPYSLILDVVKTAISRELTAFSVRNLQKRFLIADSRSADAVTYARRVNERVKLRDVAAAAGVSSTTVSHALSGKGRLPDETRRYVRQIAADLGYRPRATARNLAAGKTGLLRLVVSQTEGVPSSFTGLTYFIQVMGSATAAALEHGYALVLAPAPRSVREIDSGVAMDGTIVVDPVPGDPLVAAGRETRTPLVTTGRPIDGEQTYWIDNDIVAGTESVLDHLAARGSTRVALLTSPAVTSFAVDSRQGYDRWCMRVGQAPMTFVASDGLTEQNGYEAALDLLDRPDPPDAIYATFDRLAIGVLFAARSLGLSVPGDLLVAGCTDSDAAKSAQPSLTVLDLDPAEVGRRAVELLIDIVEGREPPEQTFFVPTRLLLRSSTRAPSARRRQLDSTTVQGRRPSTRSRARRAP